MKKIKIGLILVIVILLSGCARIVVHGYLRAVMNNGNKEQYLAKETIDDVVAPYVVIDYKIINTGSYNIGNMRFGTIVRTEITFKSKARTALRKIVEFTLANDHQIISIK